MMLCVLMAGCRSQGGSTKPFLQITLVPPADPGGPAHTSLIQGRVSGARAGQQIVLYARSGGVWWIQPLILNPFTEIQPDSTWKNTTHLGTDYAALLVEPGYHPSLKTAMLPTVGNGVDAVLVTKGETVAPTGQKIIHFGGYDWTALDGENDRGGGVNSYDSANAWTDQKGYLHLRMALHDGRWTCAEVNLTRSLGYGTYRFVVEDSAHLEPSAVLGMYTLDIGGKNDGPNELDIEMSRWGNPTGKNGQYVVQPFYVPENVARFAAPAGLLTHTFRWEPGMASFQTIHGSASSSGTKIISAHVFTSEIPAPATETVHIDLFAFHRSGNAEQNPAEVVIEKFEYLP
jgi:hypothetical protein